MDALPTSCRLSDFRRLIPVARPGAEFEKTLASRVQRVVKLNPHWTFHSFQLDLDAFTGSAKALLDDGDRPPQWFYLCLQLGEAVLRLSAPEGTQPVIHIPAKTLTVPLTVSDLCAELGGDAWRADSALFIVWGARQDAFRKPRYPLECDGVLFPILDGLGLGWAATDDTARKLGLPVDD